MSALPRQVCTAAGLLCLWAAALLPCAGFAQEARVRGDLPPTALEIDAILENEFTASEASELFEEVRRLLAERLEPGSVSESLLYLGAIQGMLDAVNRPPPGAERSSAPLCGTVLTRSEAARISEALEGRMMGLGIEFQLHSQAGVIVVARILPGSPAEAAGIQVGDQILALDGKRFIGLELPEVLSLLRGSEGSRLTLQVQRGVGLVSAGYSVSIERGHFEVRSVEERLHGGVGYIQIYQLHRSTPVEVRESFDRLSALGADRFILDLRDNAGGDVLAAASVADLFLPEGTLLGRLVEPGVGEQDLVAKTATQVENRLAVLVNGWTRGAAEALVLALQEHGRAYVIGEPTHGVDRTETLVDLGHDLFLRVRSVQMQSPTGRGWSDGGVTPDQPFWAAATDAERTLETLLGLDPLFDVALHYLETEGI